MRCLPVLASSLLPLGSQLVSACLFPDVTALGLSSGTQVGSPSESTFTQRYSTYHSPSYVVAVKPVIEQDVAKIIKFAATSEIPLLTTGGGHGFPITLGSVKCGIELDLSNLNKVVVDAKANKLTIGGGVRFGDILGPMTQAKKELPIGSQYCVGMIGATLGGGVSRYNGLHGMTLDSLSSVRLVTAAGDIVTASKTSNPDLFWGMRGAGFNYGTVVEATYDIYDETAPKVLSANFLFPPSTSQSIFEYFEGFGVNLPARLSLVFLGTDVAAFANLQADQSAIVISAVYAGSQADGLKLLQPLFDLKPTMTNITMVSWADIDAYAFFGSGAPYTEDACPKNATHNVYGGAIARFDIPTFQTFYSNYDKLLQSMPDKLAGTVFFIEFFPKQAVAAVTANATAFPWRDITAHLLFNFEYDASNKSLDAQANNFLKDARRNFTAASGFPRPQLYVSYGHGDEDLATLYSQQNVPNLKALKAAWDPSNVYRYYHPLV
ncbi:FAD-binding domain-containing protein [Lophiostoma macrostomum CBS 122681]|uniref:FAD-binding domain-containing protein n=1 Tax=Lophiostoma macrostomum CBS 122681 TaxID=1314788 RepID=A0A6A6SP09_9PLEO|nr:FAD-binding domain-containing protein [Lophiostoma macrostomum CBS 122681]